MAVDDHGLEVIKKSGEQVVPGSKADYYIKTGILVGGAPISGTNPLPTTGGTGTSGLIPVQTPTIYNVAVTLANTEYSQVLATNTRRFSISIRGIAELKLAYILGNSGTIFKKIPAGTEYTENDLDLTGVTLYFQSPMASQTVEIIQWV